VNSSLLLLLLSLAPAQTPEGYGRITGVAVNGTQGATPLSGAEVVLRANQEGQFIPIAETTTDGDGRFSFYDLPIVDGALYLPGVNRDGIHYPGPRVQLSAGQPTARVKVVAYDTVESPSPLVCRLHEIDVRSDEGLLEITETLRIANPDNVTYVGEAFDDRPPVTLRLSLPPGLDKVTFDTEFNGRNFLLHNNDLITDLPWTPGEREVKFLYRLPVEHRHIAVQRPLDLPTDHVVIRVRNTDTDQVTCNLPVAVGDGDSAQVFEHVGTALPAGYDINLQLGALSIPLEVYARWGAAIVLGLLVLAAALTARRRKHHASTAAAESRATPVRPPHVTPKRRRRRRRATSSGRNR